MTTVNPQPGDVGFATIAGMGGAVPMWGQALLHDACRFDHAFWVVRALDDPQHPDGLIVQAMPRGAEYQRLRPRVTPGYAYRTVPLTDEQRAMVPAIARTFTDANGGRGIGYSIMSYPALAAIQWRIPVPHLKAYVGNSRRLMCSQLCDEGLRRLGYHVFDDGRWYLDVTPADLYYALDPGVIQPAPPDVDGA